MMSKIWEYYTSLIKGSVNSVNLEVSIVLAFQGTWVACCLSKGVNKHALRRVCHAPAYAGLGEPTFYACRLHAYMHMVLHTFVVL